MAQAPATPKLHRHLLRLASALLGAKQVARRFTLQSSERAALDARDRPMQTQPDQVVFLIPLVRCSDVGDWQAVSDRLARTIDSLHRQSDTRWQAIICGQDRPDGLSFDDCVHFLPFTDAVTGNDKWNKLATLARALPQYCTNPSYVMPFDADDLLAPDVVEQVLRDQKPGYVVQAGYVQDASTGQIALTAPQSLRQPGQKAFWKLCGSCAVFRYETQADADLIEQITAHEHRMFPYLAALSGRKLTPLTQPSALYILNHGDNFGARRGRVSFKSRYVERFALTTRADLDTFAKTFPQAIAGPSQGDGT